VCRLFLADSLAIIDIAAVLPDVFSELEASMGGHGNGIYETQTNNIIKAVSMPTSFAAAYLQEVAASSSPQNWFAFHTRIASSGNADDDGLLHPRRVANRGAVVMQNGTWSSWHRHVPNALNDTSAIALVMSRRGVRKAMLSKQLAGAGSLIAITAKDKMAHIVRRSSSQPLVIANTKSMGTLVISEITDSLRKLVRNSTGLKVGEYRRLAVGPDGLANIVEVQHAR